MITNNGLNRIATAYSSVPAYLLVGSGNVEVLGTDTALVGEFERLALDSFDVTDNTVKFYGSRSSVVASDDVITNFGLGIAAGVGSSDLQVANLISSLVHSTDFDIGVEFWFTFNRA
jgi:hypothetical protein